MAGLPKEDSSITLFGIKGRCNPDIPYGIPPDQCAEAINVDFFRTTFVRKRNGAGAIGVTGATFSNGINAIWSHVPGADQTLRELWTFDDGIATATTNRVQRLAGGVAWANVSLTDVISTAPWLANAVSHNGKLFFTYDSPVNRLHCWDPADATIRRVGMAGQTTAATVANTGGGAYPATLRYYKVAFVVKSGSTILRRSDLTPSVGFTPSGAGTAARITRPTGPGESETHWLLYGSPTNSNFTLVATIIMATTTYDDSANPNTYDGAVAPDPSAFTCPPSAKYLALNDNRIVMGGAWETAAGDAMVPSPRRIWWTSALGATDEGDDERISNTSTVKSYTDIEEAVNGISHAVQGANYIFSYNSQWKLISTSTPGAPFVRYRIGEAKGCIEHKSIIIGEDEDGDPCIYWLSPQGPMRKGKNGDQSMYDDIADIWDTVNLAAAKVVGHGVYHRDIHQVWWWVATGSSDEPDTILVFDTRLGRANGGSVTRGWSEFTGPMAAARCSTMMSTTIGASMSRAVKPYLGKGTSVAVWKCDDPGNLADEGTQFQAYLRSRVYTPWGVGRQGGMQEEALLAGRVSAGSVLLSILRDFGVETTTSTITTTAATTEVRFQRIADGSRIAECNALQFQVGDAAASLNRWVLDLLQVPLVDEGRAQ